MDSRHIIRRMLLHLVLQCNIQSSHHSKFLSQSSKTAMTTGQQKAVDLKAISPTELIRAGLMVSDHQARQTQRNEPVEASTYTTQSSLIARSSSRKTFSFLHSLHDAREAPKQKGSKHPSSSENTFGKISNNFVHPILRMSTATKRELSASEKPQAHSLEKNLSLPSARFIPTCQQFKDLMFGGLFVDCRGLGLKAIDLHWLPENTTTLRLDSNSIDYIDNRSFVSATRLRYLNLSGNRISTLNADVFRGLHQLESLDLRGNNLNLDYRRQSGTAFRGLVNLRDLRLDDNGNSERDGRFSPSLLQHIRSLRSLGLDTFSGHLNFSSIFRSMSMLTSLTLTGGLTKITNDTFQNFKKIPLKLLYILYFREFKTDPGAFSNLKMLDELRFEHFPLGANVLLEIFAPFAHTNLTRISMTQLRDKKVSSSVFLSNAVLSKHSCRFITKICVMHVALTNSRLYRIESGALSSDTWRRCLKILDLSQNPLTGERAAFFQLSTFQSLEMLFLSDAIDAEFQIPNEHTNWRKVSTCLRGKAEVLRRSQHAWSKDRNTKGIFLSNNPIAAHTKLITFTKQNNSAVLHPTLHRDIKQECSQFIRFPTSLRVVYLQRLTRNFGTLSMNLCIRDANNLTELFVSNLGLKDFTGRITGLENLRTLDISKNYGNVMSPEFLDTFPNIDALNMAGMQLNTAFMAEHRERLFRNLYKLETLDLSNNGLNLLSFNTFKTNKLLTSLNLARNRFLYLPDSIRLLPSLCNLDFRMNSIASLSSTQMEWLDSHAERSPQLTLWLDGNLMACSCSDIMFISWLHSTPVNLDKNSNFSCISENGVYSSTASFTDIQALWRSCVGKTALIIALTLVLATIAAFLLFTVCVKMKTRVQAFLLRAFGKDFKMKTPSDYQIGAYIGYADQDNRFACFVLRPYIENVLQTTVYVRDRDLLLNSDMPGSIIDAINKSWRVIFIVTEHFLTEDLWSFFSMKTASYSVSATNPTRIIVMYEKRLWHRIPAVLLEVVQEENLVPLENTDRLCRREKEDLRCAIMT